MKPLDFKSLRFGLCLALASAVLILAILLFPYLSNPDGDWWKFWGVNKGTKATASEVLRNLGIIVAAFVGLGVAWWRADSASDQATIANKQANLTEQGQITDRYTKAVEMLAGDSLRTRVGAVYALARISQDSTERDHIPVMEVLTQFIREPTRAKKVNERADARQEAIEARKKGREVMDLPSHVACPDIHAALKVIAARTREQKIFEGKEGFEITLERARLDELDLEGAMLGGLSLKYASFFGANLTGADLAKANLTGVRFKAPGFGDAEGLTQKQLDKACADPESPPVLPEGLEWRGKPCPKK